MPKRGKKYRAAAEKVDPLKQYAPEEGVKLVKETAFAKFDESVGLHIRTGLDPRHADQVVRGSAGLTAGPGAFPRGVRFSPSDKTRGGGSGGGANAGAREAGEE